jgi:hypothetical protein
MDFSISRSLAASSGYVGEKTIATDERALIATKKRREHVAGEQTGKKFRNGAAEKFRNGDDENETGVA